MEAVICLINKHNDIKQGEGYKVLKERYSEEDNNTYILLKTECGLELWYKFNHVDFALLEQVKNMCTNCGNKNKSENYYDYNNEILCEDCIIEDLKDNNIIHEDTKIEYLAKGEWFDGGEEKEMLEYLGYKKVNKYK